MRHVVLGAGPLGTCLAGQLGDRGDDVSLYSVMGDRAYDMPGTSPVEVDGTDPRALKEACAGADAIYLLLNAHYVDWYELYPPRMAAAIETAEATAARLIYHDNMYMFGPAREPLTETTPHRSTTHKGRLRSEMAATLIRAMETGRIRGVIGRSADMYGPGALNSSFNSTLGERHFYPMLAGKPVSILGNVDVPHTYAYVPDVAAALLTLATRPDAMGDLWHVPSAPALSHGELLAIAFELAGRKARIRSSALSAFFVKAIGSFQSDVGEVAELLYQFQKPLVVSHDKYAAHFGVNVTSHREALAATLDWYRVNPKEAG